MLDTLFSGGTVYDREGNPPQLQDLAVRNGRLAATCDQLVEMSKKLTKIDASGLTQFSVPQPVYVEWEGL